ncbi:MAG TPA: M1 family aminopeptidase, partial [Verrucomicrobiae bacterium]|nr:M1 family aminopeptidase [Verrucomicrobiae bacterium]
MKGLIYGWAIAGLITAAARAESEDLYCRQHNALVPTDVSVTGRKYAPSREIDILHLAIDVTPDFKQRSIEAEVTLRFKPIAKPFSELRLDAVDLSVANVGSSDTISGWHASDKEVVIAFDPAIPVDKEATVNIRYSATPRKGLYFRTPEMGYKPEDTHLWTQGEPIEARHWYPSFDAPNEKFTSEVTCHVPEGMVVLSNGKMISEEKDAGTGLTGVRWLQDKPHVNYLIALAAGKFKKVEDKYKDIPLAFYTPASQIEHAMNSFKDTKDIMAFFEQEIGVAYPWAKYYQVCVDDFVMGGMENTSLTILTDSTLHSPDSEPIRSSQGLVAHEMAHQWFGDLVTCKDWAHLWLNEGFATYYDALYEGHKHGPDALRYTMYQSGKGIMAQPNQTNAIVRRDWRDPEEQFSYLAYPKGSWVLHMLRGQLGEDLYRRCIKTYLERFQFGNAETEDLNRVIEELSGRSFDRFFDQWVYHAAYPDVAVSYNWDEKNKLAKLTLTQNQKLSEDVLLFEFPLTIRFKAKGGKSAERKIIVKEKSEDFYFPLSEAPEIVRLDPELTVLAKFAFNPPTPMIYAQLADSSDMLGRLIAAEQLSSKKDKDTVKRLKDVLNKDDFYGVRLAAAQSLRSIQSDEALEALLASRDQSDARVRRQVLSGINGFYRDTSYQAALKTIPDEKNPEIKTLAISSLAGYAKPEVKSTFLKFLNSESYKNAFADAAIQGIRAQDDPELLEPLLKTLKDREPQFTSTGLARGLDTVAFLARNEKDKDPYREFIVQHVNSKRQRVQLAAINALGTLGDPKSVAVLEKFTGSVKESPERAAAEKAIAAVRDQKKAGVELGTLRTEVMNLQKDNRELRKELDDVKKKLEALAPKPTNGDQKTESTSTKTKKTK